MVAMSAHAVETGEPMPVIILDWASRKLPRVCRSSLAAEAQAGAIAVDQLEWCKVLLALIIDPHFVPEGTGSGDETWTVAGGD